MPLTIIGALVVAALIAAGAFATLRRVNDAMKNNTKRKSK